jgi:S1-C subfamily serine protease
VPELIENGRYPHPWLGVRGYRVFPELAGRLGLPIDSGVLIAQVVQGGPAAQGGLRGGSREVVLGNTRLLVGGDIIVDIDGVAIEGNAALREFLETRTRVGQEVVVKFYRGDEPSTTRVTLGERRQ